MEIVEFLTVRLAEDEATARAVDDNSPPWTGEWIVRDAHALGTRNGWCLAYPHEGREFAPGLVEHIARHDPARVLAEVGAKRAIIARHSPHAMGGCRTCEAPHWGTLVCNRCHGQAWPCADVRDITGVYRAHPGRQEEWATDVR
jgi:hypothetical protein